MQSKLRAYPFVNKRINDFYAQGIIPKNAIEYCAEILSVKLLLEFCKNYREKEGFDFIKIGYQGGVSKLVWESVPEYGRYRKILFNESMMYLAGTVPEQNFCALIEVDCDEVLYIKFHEHSYPFGEERFIINYELEDKELAFFRTAIAQAVELQ